MSESLSTTPSNAIGFELAASLDLAGAEISGFDPASDRLFVTCSDGLQVVDLSDPSAPSLITTIDFTSLGFATTDITSVAVKNGLVAVALPAADKADPGQVVFLDAATGALLGAVEVGALPDMLTFTPDGSKLLVANEGELNEDGTDGAGSVSIIDVSAGAAAASVVTAGFTSFDGQEEALRAAGVRIFAGRSVSQDVEPEYIAVSADGTQAMVTLQEANAVGILDLASGAFTSIVPLGSKDFSTLLADFSDRDGGMNLQTGQPVHGLYLPDAIDSFQAAGGTYYVIANEGDDRDDFLDPGETIRVGDDEYDLDDSLFPDEAALKEDAALGRLTVSNAPGLRGDTDGDGDIDEILVYGGRSFSILDAEGHMVFDSADIIERIVATEFPALFDDARSDNKGPEPEGIEVASIGGHTYALVALERSNLTLAFDITDPANVTYAGAAQRDGDEAPEGTLFIAAEDSPTGQALYVASNEGSDSISVFTVTAAPAYTLQILHASDFEAGLQATSRAAQFAAIVDRLEDDYANSITLASGDNYIPSPFFNAEGDPAMSAVLRAFYADLLGVEESLLASLGTDLGRVDIAIMNALGVQASVFGNHEFDLGTRTVLNAIDMTASGGLATSIGAMFPYLSANLDFSGDADLKNLFTAALRDAASYATTAEDLLAENIGAEAADQQIAPWTTITEGGETIGVLGVTTQILASISSPGNVLVKDPAGDGGVNNTDELAQILQPLIDEMTAQGINKIVLLSHLQQYQLELELAGKLSGVDVIISGGSHAVFADGTDRLTEGVSAAETYPVIRTGADGKPVAIVNTGGEYYNVGRLVIGFDAEGVIIPDSVDAEVSGAYVADDTTVDALYGEGEDPYAEGTRGGEVKQLTDAIDAIIEAKTSVVAGYTDVYLQGQRGAVRTQETNFGNLTADANLAFAKSVDGSVLISLKNGGGIREGIGTVGTGEIPSYEPPLDGKITQLDIENALRFNNGLSLITVSAQGLLDILENALRGANPGATPGAFPQVSGLRFSFDPGRAPGDRVLSLAVVDADGKVIDVVAEDGVLVGDVGRVFRLVTLNFLADGGDGYLGAGGGTAVTVTDRVDLFDPSAPSGYATAGREQDVLADYLAANHGTPAQAFDEADTAASLDGRVQNLSAREEAVLPDQFVFRGTDEANLLQGAGRDDVLHALGGDDTVAAGGGADTVGGGDGHDLLDGGAGADLLRGLAGDDRVIGRGGNDLLDGGLGADTLSGGAGRDRLQGGAGDDLLLGGEGADRLLGGAGDDELRGGGGADRMLGGAGADRFSFAALAHSTPAARDVIIDFSVEEGDRIDLSLIDAAAGLDGDQALLFVGAGGFVGGGIGSVRIVQTAANSFVLVDAGDGGEAEMSVLVRGTSALTEESFIL